MQTDILQPERPAGFAPATGSAFIRDSVNKRLRELRDKCALEKEGLRHATEPGYWGTDNPGQTYWADMKARCAVERKETYAQALNALECFIAEHRSIMGEEWVGNNHGRLCWSPYLGGCPIDQHYCQKPEGHTDAHANEIGAWPIGVRNEHQWHELRRSLPPGATGLETQNAPALAQAAQDSATTNQ